MNTQPGAAPRIDRTLIAHLKSLSVADRLSLNDKAVNVALELRRAFGALQINERR
ncbi:MAG: hypothetical protein H7Z43_15280 [Clostridia bacterium]|nr:hypothetical protein [Deltaproteobacteria bacterium]